MKAILLCGGAGTRLAPLTKITSKQLLPIYDKPMVYYSLSTLLLAGIKDILIISTPTDLKKFKDLFGSGDELGIKLSYAIQEQPNGIGEAFLIAEQFLGREPCCLMLGDNFFHGTGLVKQLQDMVSSSNEFSGATLFAYHVSNACDYGVVELDENNQALGIEEKPKIPKSPYAVTGLYFYDHNVVEIAKSIQPSDRDELEITDINEEYLRRKNVNVEILGRGVAWLDTGTPGNLLEASNFVRAVEHNQGLKIGCIEEICWRNKWITDSALEKHAARMGKGDYGLYLEGLLK